MDSMTQKHWYSEPWVWLLIALPMAAVISGFLILWLAIKTNDGLVVDDYYERGKEINMDLARDKAALRRGVNAEISLEPAANAVDIRLGKMAGGWPAHLKFSLLHPTRAGHDVVIDMMHAGSGNYRGTVPAPTNGHWYVQLEADDWRLFGTLHVPQKAPLRLVPGQ
jgi:hypothetical protein